MNTAIACPHLTHQPALNTLYVLDSHLHMTDGFVQCGECGATYLVELADTTRRHSVFRISSLRPEAVEQTIHALNRGSCDISRARNEVFSLASDASELQELLVMQDGAFTRTVPRPDHVNIPKRSWRELACDGSLVHAALGAAPRPPYTTRRPY